MKVEEIEIQICQTGNEICKQTLPANQQQAVYLSATGSSGK